MLELRPSIVAVNPAPANLTANKFGFMGSLAFRSFVHWSPRSVWAQASGVTMNGALTLKFPRVRG